MPSNIIVIRLSLAACAGLVLTAAAPLPQASPSFCERMAPQIGMVAVERGRQGQTTGEWRVNTLSGIGPALFGGTSVMSISIRPVGEHSYEQAIQAVDEACDTTKRGQICRITRPLRVKIGTRKGEADVESAVGEQAEVEIRNTTIFCRDPKAFKQS